MLMATKEVLLEMDELEFVLRFRAGQQIMGLC